MKNIKFCVIGLGRFGYQLATALAENGMEVLAVDSNETIIASIRNYVTHAVCMRVTDEKSLQSIGVEEMDTVIVAMGENFSQSIMVTTLLKKRLNVPTVIARAINDIHRDILKLVGADRIIAPEREVGIRLADNLCSPFLNVLRLSKNFSVIQVAAPAEFVGKSVEELMLYQKHHIHCIGIKKDDTIEPISPSYIIQKDDRLVFSGPHEALENATV